jgi:hypothetical protein
MEGEDAAAGELKRISISHHKEKGVRLPLTDLNQLESGVGGMLIALPSPLCFSAATL